MKNSLNSLSDFRDALRAIPLDTTDQKTLKLVEQKAHAATETNYFQKMIEVLCGKSISEIQNYSLASKASHPQFARIQKPERFINSLKQPSLVAAIA